MSAAPETAAKPKSKLMLIIIIAVVVLALLAGGVLFLMLKKPADDSEHGDEPAKNAQKSKKSHEPQTPPEFLPLDNLVVNLADQDTTRYAQVGITLQVTDTHTADTVKKFMPAIRNGALMMISARTGNDLLQAEGKQKLQEELLEMIRAKTEMEGEDSPVQAVLFSSLIVQ